MLTTEAFLKIVDNFIDTIYRETGFPVVIYDTYGYIIRATDKSRIGDLHAGAEKIMRNKLSEYAIDAEEALLNPLVKEGFSCPIIAGNKIIAGFGITGALDQVTPLARIATTTITAWIKEHESRQKLERSEKKYRSIFNHSLNGIYQADTKGKFLSANPRLATILGYGNPDELINTISDISTQIYVNRKDRADFLKLLQENEQVEGFKTKFRRKDGTILDAKINARMLHDLETNDLYIEGIIEDVTELTKADKALRTSEEKFYKAFNNCPLWVVLSSLESGRYIDVNETFLRTMGYHRGEIINRTSLEIGSWTNPLDRVEIVNSIKSEGKIENFEVARQTRNGDVLTMLFWGEKITVSGEDCLLSVSLDITANRKAELEKTHLEQALAHSQKLDAVGQLAGGIAHDFNNMLGGIMGAAEMLTLHTSKNQKAQKLTKMILDAAGRAADLTGKLLTFSRGTPPTSSVIDIHEIIEETTLLLQNTIDRRIILEIGLNAETFTIVGDPSLLQNSLLNIGINASQAMPEGGKLWFATDTVELDKAFCETSTFELLPGKYLKIQISDTGYGIPDEYIHKIFDPFFTTKEQGQGTGLGLAAVYGAVCQHNGSITVRSEAGSGAEFELLLPLADSELLHISSTPEIKKGNGRILVVDDEEIMRLTAQAILQDLGYDVVLATEGQEALSIYRKAPDAFDVVLLDMIMPIMNGRDCFSSLMHVDPNVRVILSSGFSKEEDFLEMSMHGLKGFIRKPYRRATLSQAIHEAMQ